MAKLNFKKIQSRVGSAAGLVAGSVAGAYAGKTIENLGKGKIKPVVNAGIRLVLGAALPSVVGGGKKEGFISDFSNGIMAQAGVELAKALNVPGITGTEIDAPIGNYTTSVYGTDVDNPVSGVAN
ncbi:MAG TPA: hypothetical protein PLN30_00505 [Ferruginibacter sp.]|nr:hypothetical protein [Ferruginibacter sp.]